MKRTILLCFAVITFLSSCMQSPCTDIQSLSSSSSSSFAFNSSSPQITTPPYFSFEDYSEMTKVCNAKTISERYKALDNHDLPSRPTMTVRLCKDDLLVLELESMSASQEFLIIVPEKQWFGRVSMTSAGVLCTADDGCDQVTDQECSVKKGCTHFRSISLDSMTREPIVVATLLSKQKMTVTDDDFRSIAQDQGHLFFHLGSDAYSRVTGILESLAPESTGSLLSHRQRSGKNQAVLLRGGEETIMDTSPITAEHGVFGFTYQDFSISPSGRFAFFRGMGWESARTFFFDIERKKVALSIYDAHDFGVTPNEKTFYACASNQLSGEVYGRLYHSDGSVFFSFLDLPQMKEIPMDDSFIREVNCFYDEVQSVMTFCATLQKNTSDADSRNICLNVDPTTGSVMKKIP